MEQYIHFDKRQGQEKWRSQCWFLQFESSLSLIYVTISFTFLNNLPFAIYFSVLVTLLQLFLSTHLPPL